MRIAPRFRVLPAIAWIALVPAAPPARAVADSVHWFKVTDGASAQSRIDACIAAGGGVVYFPPGVYALPASATLRLYPNRTAGGFLPGLTLLGDGQDVSIITCANADTLLHVLRDNVVVQGLTFQTSPTAADTSLGIVLGDVTDARHVLKFIKFRDVTVRGTGRQAVQVLPAPHITIASSFDGCRFTENRGTTELVSVGRGNTTLHFRSCTFEAFRQSAVTLRECDGVTFSDCIFENELNDAAPFFYADRSVNASITSGWFEDDANNGVGGSSSQWFIQLDRACHGFQIGNCTFRRGGLDAPSASPKAVLVSGTTSTTPPRHDESVGVVITNPEILSAAPRSTTTEPISVASDSSKVILVGGFTRQATSPAASRIPSSARVRRP